MNWSCFCKGFVRWLYFIHEFDEETVMRIGTLFALLLTVLFSFGLSACDRDGPAEQAGEDVDRAIENAGERMEEAGDKAEDATDR